LWDWWAKGALGVLRTSKGSVCPQDERTSRCCDFVHPPRAFVNYNFALNEQRTATTKIPLKSLQAGPPIAFVRLTFAQVLTCLHYPDLVPLRRAPWEP